MRTPYLGSPARPHKTHKTDRIYPNFKDFRFRSLRPNRHSTQHIIAKEHILLHFLAPKIKADPQLPLLISSSFAVYTINKYTFTPTFKLCNLLFIYIIGGLESFKRVWGVGVLILISVTTFIFLKGLPRAF